MAADGGLNRDMTLAERFFQRFGDDVRWFHHLCADDVRGFLDEESRASSTKIQNLVAAVEGVYPYLTDEVIEKLRTAVEAVKGTHNE